MSPPRVSILLPVFNGEPHLQSCLDSVLQQSYADFELLVGDDASTDGSPALLGSVRDPRIRLTRQTERRGLFANLNLLVARAQSPLLRFLCQDDQLEPACLAQEAAFLASHPDVPMCFSKARWVDETGREVGRAELHDLPDLLSPSLAWQQFLYHGCIPANLSTVCARREAVARAGGFDSTFTVAGDYDLWVKLCEDSSLGIVHQHLVRVRSHAGQLTRSPAAGVAFVRENRRVQAALLARAPEAVQRRARTYLTARYSVLDVHHLVSCLSQGRLADAVAVSKALGPSELLKGLFLWVVTLDNRLYRPRAPFVESATPASARDREPPM